MSSDPKSSAGLRELHGRGMNSLSEKHGFPADQQEHDRLNLQHQVWKAMLGDLFPLDISLNVAKALSFQDGMSRAVLDIGTGSGIWAVEMAYRYPHVNVKAMDLAPVRPRFTPPNCSFEVCDVTLDALDAKAYTGGFDLIHTRSLLGHIKNPIPVVLTIANWLKSGGLYIFGDGDFTILDEHMHPVKIAKEGEPSGSHSWFARLLSEVPVTGDSPDPGMMSPGWKIEGWLRESGLFERIQVERFHAPINWAGRDEDGIVDGAQLGELHLKNLMAYLDSVRPLLLLHHDADFVEELISKSRKEISGPTIRLYMKWHTAWAYRK